MRIFEYPYVIITILVFCFIIMGAVGLYFVLQCAKVANGEEEKGFLSAKKLENSFEKLRDARKERCVVYACVASESMGRLYSTAREARILLQIRSILLESFVREENESISAYGKREFVMVNVLSEKDIENRVRQCYEKICKILSDNEGINIVQINFGIYCTASTQVLFNTALGRAKQAYTMAKEQNTLCFQWDNSNGKEFERKIKIENSIQEEIENNRFFLEYQPIVDAKTQSVVGAEVLSRLNSKQDGILTPKAFLSAVSNVGLNEKFDYYIFEKNCKWISNEKELREKYVYTINFSRSTLCNSDFANNIIEIVEKYGLNYSSIAIEILEDKSLSEEQMQTMTKNIAALKKKGALILLDDFGKGYTSFSDLSNFEVSIVKIDKHISQNATDKTGFVILKNIIRTAKDLGFKTLCEGIETPEQRDIIVKAGCDLLQGYYFYHPMPVAQMEKLFEENR